MISDAAGGRRYTLHPVLTVYFQKWANAGRCWAADQHLLRSYKRFECNRDLKLSEVRCLEYSRSFTTRRAIFTSSSRLVRGNLTGWLGTIISKAVRALAARLVQRQRIFVTTPWLWLLVLCLFGKHTILCIY